MYYGYRPDGSILFASEMKCMIDECPTFELFPPGHLMTNEDKTPRRWYKDEWTAEQLPSNPLDLKQLRDNLEGAVVKRMMCDVPYGVLLSGGLDSSLVASIASRHAKKRVESGEELDAWWPRLHTFSIGLKGSPDLANARVVAEFLETAHHEYHFTLEEGLDAVKEVIQAVETYDITTIRASTPMYLMARKIKALGVKMVLSGEGADEVFGGYLYFHKAPNKEEFHNETCRKVKALHQYDCNRANKSTSAWGVEARVPFLDKGFVGSSMLIDPEEKMCKNGRIEKWMVRKAFDTPDQPYLPDSVLWRQKEQFSDGVGYSWIDTLKEVAEAAITDAQMASAEKRFPVNTPTTKEGYRYREIFEEIFKGHNSAIDTVPGGPTVACSSAKAVEWDESFKRLADASGRAVGGVHVDAYETEPATKKAKTK
jgi:asparagine synthase (glutamine-hydrolysing)